MNDFLINWLHECKNYIYFDGQNDFQKDWASLFFKARISKEYLQASPFYTIIKTANKTSVDFHKPTYRNHNFLNFNQAKFEHLKDIAALQIIATYKPEDTNKTRAQVILLLLAYEKNLKNKNEFIELDFEDILFDFHTNNYIQIQQDIEQNFIDDNFNFEEFQENYISRVKKKIADIQEIGIFLPFIYKHNIFEKKHYLLEMNGIKFKRKDENIYRLVKDFYIDLEVNARLDKKLFKLKDYFHTYTDEYQIQFAYLDPFEFIKKFDFENKVPIQLNNRSTLNTLIHIFNKIHYNAILYQQHHLINMLSIARSKDRLYSFNELINLQIKHLKSQVNSPIATLDLEILNTLKPHTNTSDIPAMMSEIQNHPKEFQDRALEILGVLLTKLGKLSTQESFCKLHEEYFYDMSSLDKNDKKIKKFIQSVIKYIWHYGDVPQKDNKTKRINFSTEKIFQQKQYTSLNKLVDFENEKKLIENYSAEFDKYNPEFLEGSTIILY